MQNELALNAKLLLRAAELLGWEAPVQVATSSLDKHIGAGIYYTIGRFSGRGITISVATSTDNVWKPLLTYGPCERREPTHWEDRQYKHPKYVFMPSYRREQCNSIQTLFAATDFLAEQAAWFRDCSRKGRLYVRKEYSS